MATCCRRVAILVALLYHSDVADARIGRRCVLAGGASALVTRPCIAAALPPALAFARPCWSACANALVNTLIPWIMTWARILLAMVLELSELVRKIATRRGFRLPRRFTANRVLPIFCFVSLARTSSTAASRRRRRSGWRPTPASPTRRARPWMCGPTSPAQSLLANPPPPYCLFRFWVD